MNNIYYESGTKERIYLDQEPFWMQTGDFLDYEWLYNTRNNCISGFQKEISEKEFLITVFGNNDQEYSSNWARIHDVFEKDVCNMTPGKLYFGEYYLVCYIFASEKTEWEYDCNMHDNLYRLVTDYPFWIKESTILIPTVTAPVAAGLTYPYTYDYMYGENGFSVTFENDHFTACDFRLTAHGLFDKLTFAINGNLYEVDVTCKENESITIDTKDETIIKTDIYGNRWNVYGDQNFDYNNFAKIPPGKIALSYSRNHALEFTFYRERSEPKWGTEVTAGGETGLLMEDGSCFMTEDGYYLLIE